MLEIKCHLSNSIILDLVYCGLLVVKLSFLILHMVFSNLADVYVRTFHILLEKPGNALGEKPKANQLKPNTNRS